MKIETAPVKVITGRTANGNKGIRFEHALKIGMQVKIPDGREGRIVGEGVAGMPEVELKDGSTCLFWPSELMIISSNV